MVDAFDVALEMGVPKDAFADAGHVEALWATSKEACLSESARRFSRLTRV